MDVDQSSPRSDLLPHHSDEGEWEISIEDIQSSVEGVCAAIPHRKVSATTTMSAAAEHLFNQGIDRVIAQTPPNRFPQSESPKRLESLSYYAPVQKQDMSSFRRLPLSAGFAKGFVSYQEATLNKGTSAGKRNREYKIPEVSTLPGAGKGIPVPYFTFRAKYGPRVI
jgi:hypothetical protein